MTKTSASQFRVWRSTCLAVSGALVLALFSSCVSTPTPPHEGLSLAGDLDELLRLIDHEYVYRVESGCDTTLLRQQLRPRALTATSRNKLLPVLESALECLHDNHATFNTNLDTSTRLVPSGLQVWAEWQSGRAVVTEVRHDSAALHAGIRRGDVIESIDNVPVATAVERRVGCCVSGPSATEAARQWALLALLAGRHDQSINLSLSHAGTTRSVTFDPREPSPTDSLPNVVRRRNSDGTGYISINNLGDTETVTAFDAALAELRDTTALFLDLRNTPGGGNTDVAEPILGRLIDRKQPYQRIAPLHGKAWLRRVSPRGPWQYKGPVTVLVSRWTGSMGEGMAIGLDGMKRARVCGSRMAALNGSVFDHVLPVTKITVRLPGERLSHLSGTPRESFVPALLVEDAETETAINEESWISSSMAACR